MTRKEALEAMMRREIVVLFTEEEMYWGRLKRKVRHGFLFEGIKNGKKFVTKVQPTDLVQP
ncbi:hypothetical protein IH779_03430 [Patescibacteria group bacterium]|nr:hypothetical protein [Patescibacteria group bacterium]